jgi:hypothetical protein
MKKDAKKEEKPKASKLKKVAVIKIEASEPTKEQVEKVTSAEAKEAPVVKTKRNDKGTLVVILTAKFQEIRETLSTTTEAKKQPRQLRWALKQLAMAEEAANRAITHAE